MDVEIDALLRQNREDALAGRAHQRPRPRPVLASDPVVPVESEPVSTFADLERVVTTLADRHGLTPREREVLRLVLLGDDNGEIGRELGVALRTVKTHVEHIWQKVDVCSRAKLMGLLFIVG